MLAVAASTSADDRGARARPLPCSLRYLLYKHCLLHGLNLSVALELARDRPRPSAPLSRPIAEQPAFRVYWAALNAAYVMEFFLQTLVRRGLLAQVSARGWCECVRSAGHASGKQVVALRTQPRVVPLAAMPAAK